MKRKRPSDSSKYNCEKCNMISQSTIFINISLRANLINSLNITKIEISKSIDSSLSQKNINFDMSFPNSFLKNQKSERKCITYKYNPFEMKSQFNESPKRNKYNLLMKHFMNEKLPEEKEIKIKNEYANIYNNLIFKQMKKRI